MENLLSFLNLMNSFDNLLKKSAMKIYKTSEIKNIALLGSKGSGKTTLAESMMFECGVTKRRGSVDAGNTISDYFPVEKDGYYPWLCKN